MATVQDVHADMTEVLGELRKIAEAAERMGRISGETIRLVVVVLEAVTTTANRLNHVVTTLKEQPK